MRTPWRREVAHATFDRFELLDGDTELLVCLIQAQLAANISEPSDHSRASETDDLPTFDTAWTRRGCRAHVADRVNKGSLTVPSHEMWRKGSEPKLNIHANTSKQMQVQQVCRRAFHLHKKAGA